MLEVFKETIDAFWQGVEEAGRERAEEPLDLGDCGRFYTRLLYRPSDFCQWFIQFWTRRDTKLRLKQSIPLPSAEAIGSLAERLTAMSAPLRIPQEDMPLPWRWRLWLYLCGKRVVHCDLIYDQTKVESRSDGRAEYESQMLVRAARTEGWAGPAMVFLISHVSRTRPVGKQPWIGRGKPSQHMTFSTFRITLDEAATLSQQLADVLQPRQPGSE